ncbi:hypothetical protein GCM10010406_36090 [Streptomyces thermolineatus]|uniref:PAC domain-containing protein n=1 Tax=Streptomyces thermolineatus TaxID=44033 RepID=A0ABP5ZCG7_9ACTN
MAPHQQPDRPPCALPGPASRPARTPGASGSAEWNLVTDEVSWSGGLFRIFGRDPADGPLSLDELPSWLCAEDRQALTAAVAAGLVDGRPVDGRFRIVRPDGAVRAVHVAGEPLLDADGGALSLRAVVRDLGDRPPRREGAGPGGGEARGGGRGGEGRGARG